MTEGKKSEVGASEPQRSAKASHPFDYAPFDELRAFGRVFDSQQWSVTERQNDAGTTKFWNDGMLE